MKNDLDLPTYSSPIQKKFASYWQLIKSHQTGLLLITGVTGYMSARCPILHLDVLLGLSASLFLAIAGSTILNMIYDRDIDAKMDRTAHRPLPSGKVKMKEALFLGLIVSFLGLGLAFLMSPLFGWVLLAGIFLDVVVYTIWLKRRTALSIVWGGLAGGMPVLAGRVLATGKVDLVGCLFALAIVLWIPTHIITYSARYSKDYASAGIPTIPSVYGRESSRLIVVISSFGAAAAIVLAALSLGLSWGYMWLLVALSTGIMGLALKSMVRPSEAVNLALFKYASIYMLGSMLIVSLEGIF